MLYGRDHLQLAMWEERGKWALDGSPEAVTKLIGELKGFEPSAIELPPSSG